MKFFNYFKSNRELMVRVVAAECALKRCREEGQYWRMEAKRSLTLQELAKLGHTGAQDHLFTEAIKNLGTKKD